MIYPEGRTVHANLDTAFTRFDDLVSVLGKKKFTGHLRVKAAGYEGVLVFESGGLSVSLDAVQGEAVQSGEAAKSRIYEHVRGDGVEISVYTMPGQTQARLISMGGLQPAYKNLTSDFTQLDSLKSKLQKDARKGCISVAASDRSWVGLSFISEEHTSESFLTSERGTVTGQAAWDQMLTLAHQSPAVFNVFVASAGAAATSKKTVAAASAAPAKETAADQLAPFWSDIIAEVERTVMAGTNESFITAFLHVIGDLAGKYPYLHPLSGEFRYENGKAVFDGSAERYTEGLGRCLDDTVRRLDASLPASSLYIIVKAALQPLVDRHAAILTRYGIASHCPLFEMTTYEKVLSVAYPLLGKNTESFISKQCLKKMKVTPEKFSADHLEPLSQIIEKSAGLLISKADVQQLCKGVLAC